MAAAVVLVIHCVSKTSHFGIFIFPHVVVVVVLVDQLLLVVVVSLCEQLVESKVPVHVISYNSPDQATVVFLKSLAHAANTKSEFSLLN